MGLTNRPGEPFSERLHAVIVPDFDVLRERKIVNAREVIRFDVENLSMELPSTKRILSFDLWPDPLPRTTTRKLKRFEIQRRVMAGERHNGAEGISTGGGHLNDAESTSTGAEELTAEEALWLSEPEAQRAIAIIRSAVKTQKPVQPSSNLELDLGFDSMERVELVVALEREFGVEVDDRVISAVYTVRELVDTILAAREVSSTTAAGAAASDVTPNATGSTPARRPRTSSAAGWDAVFATAPDDPEVGKALHTSVVFTFLWFLLGRIAVLFARICFGLEVSGRDKLPKKGPFILSPNHQSFLDGPLVASLMPWRLFKDMFYVGTSEIFGKHVGLGLFHLLGRTFKLVPVDPDSNLVNAMRAAAYGLKQGDNLVLYPEGERSIDGTPKKFKKGAAILSTHLQVPIYPVALEGFYDAWPRHKKLPRLSKLRVRFGDPIPPPPFNSPTDSARLVDPDAPSTSSAAASPEEIYKQVTEELRNRVVEMWEELRQKQKDPQPVAAGD